MAAAEIQESIDELRAIIDAILDEGVTGGVDLIAAATLLTEAKRRLASVNRLGDIYDQAWENA